MIASFMSRIAYLSSASLLVVGVACDRSDDARAQPEPVDTASASVRANPPAEPAGSVESSKKGSESGLIVTSSPDDVPATVKRIREAIEEKGLKVMATVDHAANAEGVDLELPPTVLIIFGNPAVGTKLMQKQRSIAIDLPMKMLVWQNEAGETKVAFNTPSYLFKRHGVRGMDETAAKIRSLLDALANPG
ncbi:MAG: DUF302 domain-containing protein [Myxococcota bacterium]